MIPWVLVDTATVPDGSGSLRLMRRGDEFSIMSGSNELMNSRVNGSEKALADLACDKIRSRPNCSVLIGGLGMGFTLRAALSGLGRDARVIVAELVPQVVAWAKGPMAELSAACLADPRVSILEADVAVSIASGKSSFGAILLDVDNGPEGLTRSANDRLYDRQGLQAARRALRPGGILAVWSSAPNGDFSRKLRQSSFNVDEVEVRANGRGGGARHVVRIATNPGGTVGTIHRGQPGV